MSKVVDYQEIDESEKGKVISIFVIDALIILSNIYNVIHENTQGLAYLIIIVASIRIIYLIKHLTKPIFYY